MYKPALTFLTCLLMLESCSSDGGNSSTENTGGNNNSGNTMNNGVCPSALSLAIEATDMINTIRASGRNCGNQFYPAVTAVKWNTVLEQSAQSHSEDMATHNFVDHTGSDGLNPGQRLTNAGYNWSTYAENISAGRDSLQQTVDGWLSSPGHCANIMKADVTETGLACAWNQGADFQVYWTQVFAKPN